MIKYFYEMRRRRQWVREVVEGQPDQWHGPFKSWEEARAFTVKRHAENAERGGDSA